MKKVSVINLNNHSDNRGCLYSLEEFEFDISRMFFIGINSMGTSRGNHGHKKCWQIFIPVNGFITVSVKSTDEISEFKIVEGDALIVPPNNYCTINFENTEVRVFVLASHKYDKNDYYK